MKESRDTARVYSMDIGRQVGEISCRRVGMVGHNDATIPTRRTLLSRLKNCEDQESWKEFFNLYWKLIYGVALKAGLSEAEAQDVVQETVLTVTKKIGGFDTDPARGSFKAWLLNIVRWRIADQVRKQRREMRLCDPPANQTGTTPLVEKVADPAGNALERLWEEEWGKNLVTVAMERIRGQVDPRQYQMFDLYVVKQWPVREVAQALRVNAGRVYLAKHRLSKLVRKEIETLEEQLGKP